MDFTAYLPLWGWIVMLTASALGLGFGVRLIRGDMAAKPKLTVPSGFSPTLNLKDAWKPKLDEKVESEPEPEVEKGEGTADLIGLASDLEKWKEEK